MRAGSGSALALAVLAACLSRPASLAARPLPLAVIDETADFLSHVRYLISRAEEKAFRNLPDDQRADFIRRFWEVRDPDPSTPANEFRDEYDRRLEEANRRFASGHEGWLTDRGRAFILLGPPLHVESHPLGTSTADPRAGKPYEVWHYPDFYILFVDQREDGDYQVQYTGLSNQADVHRAFLEAKRLGLLPDRGLRFAVRLVRRAGRPVLELELDPRRLEFEAVEDRMVAPLQVWLQLTDAALQRVWGYERAHDVVLARTGRTIPDQATIEIPVSAPLPRGAGFCLAWIQDKQTGARSYLNTPIRFD